MEVLRAVAKGHTTKRISKDLGLASPSIETHLHNIFKKLNVSSRVELARVITTRDSGE